MTENHGTASANSKTEAPSCADHEGEMDKALVTGGTGFVGSWMVAKLLEKGHEVHVFDKQISDLKLLTTACGDRAKEVILHSGDIAELGAVLEAVRAVDIVFHLAGVVEYDSKKRPLMEHVNVQGTATVVEACKKSKTKRLVLMSSIAAIGFRSTPDLRYLVTEKDTYFVGKYDLGYFQTKHKAEDIVMDAVRKGELDAVAVNPTTIYGPGDAYKASRGQQVKTAKGKNKFYSSGGVNVIHVEDAVEAIYKAYKLGKKGERYILGGDNLTIKDLLITIAEEAKAKPPSIYIPSFLLLFLGYFGLMGLTYERALVATKFHWGDSSKARRELGATFRPAREAIRASVHWMKANGVI
mmetsp:Transcript_52039/g.86551  ORF Transcript_52039/g.86551 Transcript_52039/m.86551 type:complete len:354 (-) Transcript_52039:590-1651(-)